MKRILKKTGRIAVVAATLLIMLLACSTGVKAETHPINIVEGGEYHYSVSPYDLPSDHKIKLVIKNNCNKNQKLNISITTKRTNVIVESGSKLAAFACGNASTGLSDTKTSYVIFGPNESAEMLLEFKSYFSL